MRGLCVPFGRCCAASTTVKSGNVENLVHALSSNSLGAVFARVAKRFPMALFESNLTAPRRRVILRSRDGPAGAFIMTSADLSPYEQAASAVVYSRAIHFFGAAEIWEAFAAKQISSKRREELLRVLRDRLLIIPLEK